MRGLLKVTGIVVALALFSSCGADRPWGEITLGASVPGAQEELAAEDAMITEEQTAFVATTIVQSPKINASMPPPPTIASVPYTSSATTGSTTQTIQATVTSLTTSVIATTIIVTSTQFMPTTAAPASPTYASLHFVDPPSIVYAGQIIELAIRGKPHTMYTFYGFNLTDNSWLIPHPDSLNKTSDEDGRASWSWRLDANTTKGPTAVRVEGGGEFATLYFAVL